MTTYTPPEFEAIKGLSIRTLNDPRLAERIRVLDDYCLPVKYSDDYYDTYVRGAAHPFNQVAYYYDTLIGSITCRLETTDTEGEYNLYIMTLCVLEPYRGVGIGARLLYTVLNAVQNEAKLRIAKVTLHAQVGSPVLQFYQRHGFTVEKLVTNYYTKLDECDAHHLTRGIPQPRLDKKKGK